MRKKAKGGSRRRRIGTGRRYGPGRPTVDDLHQRKERILDTAYALFIEKGFVGTSLVDVAKKSGVATRTIYQHYGDKADIFRAVIDQRTTLPKIDPPRIDANRDLNELLTEVANYVCMVALSKEALLYLQLMVAESHRFPDLMRQVFEVLNEHFHQVVAGAFKELARTGRIPQQDHLQSTKFFIDLLLGVGPLQATMKWIGGQPQPSEVHGKVALFIAGRFGSVTP